MSAGESAIHIAAGLSTQAHTARALGEVLSKVRDSAPPDLSLLFASHHHGPDFGEIVRSVARGLECRNVLGCTGEAIVGEGREIESQPALALWAARLPCTRIFPMHLDYVQTSDGSSFVGWHDDLPDCWPAGSALLAMGDAFTFPADQFLALISHEQPGVPVVGGMASGGVAPGQNRLFLGTAEYASGAVAVLLDGGLNVQAVVSQGCRPVGNHFVVTRSDQNLILELGGKPALQQLQTMARTLGDEERAMMLHGLHVGRVINEYQERFTRGDFLIRNVIGVDPNSGAIAIGDAVKPGQTIQFQVRDSRTAHEDLCELLQSARQAGGAPAGALLFTCNGRGSRMFKVQNHDVSAILESFGNLPTAGFFAQGELGPVGRQNFIHGFTASVALFRELASDHIQ